MDKDELEQKVEILREWYKKQPHLPKDICKDYFMTFAKGSKSLEVAKRKLDAFFTLRNDQVWFYDFDRLFDRFKKEPGGDFFFLPELTSEGYRVMVVSYERVDINKTDQRMEMFRRMLSVELAISLWPQDTSLVLVMDLKGGGFSYFAGVDISSEINVCKYLQSALPLKLKKLLLVNSQPAVENTMNLLKPFLPKKITERLVVSPTRDILRDHLPLWMIPKDYGGTAPSLENLGGNWRKKMLEMEDWFRANSKLRSDESKRPKDSGQSLDCGTFRSLAID